MAIRKNTRRFDPRYFMSERTDYREASRDVAQDMQDEADDLADTFNVKASVEEVYVRGEERLVIFVTHQDGETTAHSDTELMYQDLARRSERAEIERYWETPESVQTEGIENVTPQNLELAAQALMKMATDPTFIPLIAGALTALGWSLVRKDSDPLK